LKKSGKYLKLTPEQHQRNGRRGRKRRLIERVFAHFKKWQHYRRVRYLGLVKNQLELTLKVVIYSAACSRIWLGSA